MHLNQLRVMPRSMGGCHETALRTNSENTRRRGHWSRVHRRNKRADERTGAYAAVDLSEITNRDVFQTLLPKAEPAMAAFGGKFVIRTENILALDGASPKRFVVIAFDSF